MFNKKHLLLFTFLLLCFLFLRIYNLPNTIKMFGDTARDLLTLERWHEAGKPPLLGPHTSALSFNQSAWYFYFLYPFYLISGGSFYTANLAVIFYYLFFFGLGWWLVKHQQLNWRVFLTLLALITFQPELIKQSRDVWNPSLVLPALLLATYLLLNLKRQLRYRYILLLNLFLFFALGASYSVAPVILTFSAVATVLIYQKKQLRLKFRLYYLVGLVVSAILSLVLVNIGTIFYEFRYDFLLTKNLGNQQVLQTSSDWLAKAIQLGQLIFATNQVLIIVLFTLLFLLTFVFSLLPKFKPFFHRENLLVGTLLLSNVMFLLILPFQIHAHYIFGILSLFFVYLSLLPTKLRLVFVSLLILSWLNSLLTQPIFEAVSPTLSERQTCLQQVCQKYPAQLYVVTNSASHDHQALGYEYLGQKINCQAISILNLPGKEPKYLAVFNENTSFDQQKTDFYELNQFGQRQHLARLVCSDQLSVEIFQH